MNHPLKSTRQSGHFLLLLLATLVLIPISGGCEASADSPASSGDNVDDAGIGKKTNLVLKRKHIKDPNRGIRSHSVYVPKGWTLKGQAKWFHPNFYKSLPSLELTVASPEGHKVKIYESALFSDRIPTAYGYQRPAQGMSDGGYMVVHFPKSRREWKLLFENSLLKAQHPTASEFQSVKVERNGELTAAMQKQLAPLVLAAEQRNRQAASYGLPTRQTVQIECLTIESTFKENGQLFECVNVLGLVCTTTNMAGYDQIRWAPALNLSMEAPKGKLNTVLPLLSSVAGSIQPTPEWNRQWQRLYLKVFGRKPANSGQTDTAKTYSDILDRSHNSFRNRSNLNSTGQQKLVNSLHEVNDYSHNGTTYRLPAGYDHVYTNNQDTIVLTNDSVFDPGIQVDPASNWSTMRTR